MLEALLLKLVTDAIPGVLGSVLAAAASRWMRLRRLRRRDI